MRVGDLVRTPKVSARAAEDAMRAGLGLGYYDWEGKLGVVVGFCTPEDRGLDADSKPFVNVLIQDTGKLCVFSPSVLTSIK